MVNTGALLVPAAGLMASVHYSTAREQRYLLEGSVNAVGDALAWLGKRFGLFRNMREVDDLCWKASTDVVAFLALNGGPPFKFSYAVSMMVNCETQAELDAMWDKLSAGGATERCGWLRDKFGLSWQIVPAILPSAHEGRRCFRKVMKEVVKMTKLDIAALQRAAA